MKILMLCLGNICRSPLAEGILKQKVSDDFEIDSAGTIDMHQGKKADSRSIKIATHYGIDINAHRSRPITTQDLEYYDYIFCMDQNNYKDAIYLCQSDEQRLKVSLILNALEKKDINSEVPDPYWGNANDFDKVYKMLEVACEKIAKKLSSKQ